MGGYIHIEEVKLKNQDEDGEELFCEASEELPLCDCSEGFDISIESDVEMSSSSTITLDYERKMEKSSPANLHRRRYTSMFDDSMDSTGDSSFISFGENCLVYRGEKFEFFPEMMGRVEESRDFSRVFEDPDASKLNLRSESAKENGIEGRKVNFATGYENNARVHDFLLDDIWSVKESHDAESSFLMVLAGLVMKSIEYQFNLLISFFRFPIWVTSLSFMFVMDPFSAMKQGAEYLIESATRIWSPVFGNLPASVYELLGEPRSVMEFILNFVRTLLWLVYVSVTVMALLVSALVAAGILMKVIVEEPISMKEKLGFDYTGKSPVEFVPIIACPEACYGPDCSTKLEVAKFGGMRVIPPGHKLQVTVSLTLPESDYNRKLGIFQVRVDFLAADGKVLASSKHPSMLQFRSEPVRVLLTFLKAPPILYGLASETQDLNIKFKGFTEDAATPTACLKVTIEQRADYQPGAGVPEIHSASLSLESEQPGLKRIIWYWRTILFVWISMTIFTTELLLILLCCSPILMPRLKLGGNSATNGASSNNSFTF